MSVKTPAHNELKANIGRTGVTVVEFGAPWCPPCKSLLPILDDLDREFGGTVSICSVNVDEFPDASSEFGVMSVPAVIVFKNGQPQEKLIGLRPKQTYQNLIAKWLA